MHPKCCYRTERARFYGFCSVLEQILSWYATATLHCVLVMQLILHYFQTFFTNAARSLCHTVIQHNANHRNFFTSQSSTLPPTHLYQHGRASLGTHPLKFHCILCKKAQYPALFPATSFPLGIGLLCLQRVYHKINLLKPTGHVTHQQFNIQLLYVLSILYLCVL